MLLAFIITAFTLTCTASSFHKYPFVFLLDVGNEELGKDNAEQIKVSVPGGSLAVKYPANGEGGTIGHVRVTGIDYGTDLKANIVEGGPGYRYVVLVFTGNLGVQYDTVVTIQTLSDENLDTKDNQNMSVENGSYEVNEQDSNNSAEETDDEPETKSVYNEKMNAELMQSSYNMYSYVKKENVELNEEDSSLDAEEDDDNEINNNIHDDIDNQISDSISNSDLETNDSDIPKSTVIDYQQEENVEINSQEDDDDDSDDEVNDKIDNLQNDESTSNSESSYSIPIKILSAFKPPFYGDIMLYPQVAVPQDRVLIDHSDDDGQFNNEGQAKDLNNNVNDYISPVEY